MADRRSHQCVLMHASAEAAGRGKARRTWQSRFVVRFMDVDQDCHFICLSIIPGVRHDRLFLDYSKTQLIRSSRAAPVGSAVLVIWGSVSGRF